MQHIEYKFGVLGSVNKEFQKEIQNKLKSYGFTTTIEVDKSRDYS